MTGEVLSVGEALWDLLPEGEVLGGAPLNLAFRLRSLGVSSAIVTALGTDALGRRARETIRRYGIDERFVFDTDKLPTGTVHVEFDHRGEPSYIIVREVAYDAIPLTDSLMEAAAAANCVCFGTLAQRSPVSRGTIRAIMECRRGKPNLLDINLRPDCYDDQSIIWSLEAATLLKINEEEARELKIRFGFPEADLRELAAAVCRRFSLELCILTMGRKGACISGPQGPICQGPAYLTPRIDPLGAGDAFTAGFLSVYLENGSIEAACRRGNAMGSAVASRRGALQNIAPDEVTELERSGEPYRFTDEDFRI